MAYVTASDVRDYLNLDTADISDADLAKLISKADALVRKYITVYIEDEELLDTDGSSATIDGSVSQYRVRHTPIADSNFDGVVDSSDVSVYGWVDSSDPSSKTQLTVSSVDAFNGLITLSSAPSSSYETLTITYRFHLARVDYTTLVPLASIYAVGYLYSVKNFDLLPTTYRMGENTVTFSRGRPSDIYWSRFMKMVNIINSGIVSRVDSSIQRRFRRYSDLEILLESLGGFNTVPSDIRAV